MKYIINSSGETVSLTDSQNEFRFIPLKTREDELHEFITEFTSRLSQKGIITQGKGFAFMIQPFYTTERLLILSKSELPSTSKAVKLANMLDFHPEIMSNQKQTEFLKSIFPEESTGRVRWYFISIGYIAFERNLYDCKRINIKYSIPVPYAEFVRVIKNQLVNKDDMEKEEICPRFQLILNNIDLKNAVSLLPLSFERPLNTDFTSEFDTVVNEVLESYKADKGYRYKDKSSNKSTVCLLSINNGRNNNIYDIYKSVKTCIKKNFEGSYNIRYSQNHITAQLRDGETLSIYVKNTDTTSQPLFIIGGKNYIGIDSLKQAIESGTAFQENKWFTRSVKPNIQTVNKSQKPVILKDEIGWGKMCRKNKKRKKYTRLNRKDNHNE